MQMKQRNIFFNRNSFLHFDSNQRKGILALFCLIIVLQGGYFFADFSPKTNEDLSEKQIWLAFQQQIDSLKNVESAQVYAIHPFNPNFITDFKGYRLGMSIEEIDRLHAFRDQNKYVNSAKEFQEVTKVSDSLLRVLSVYFRFPEWITEGKSSKNKLPNQSFASREIKIEQKDINTATQEELIKVYGIGMVLSERILQQKELFGSFVSMEQLKDVWGISHETWVNLNKHFEILQWDNLKKIKVNSASIKELMQFPYFNYTLAKEIVTYRSMHGAIKGVEDLAKIKDFPVEKLDIIILYLEI